MPFTGILSRLLRTYRSWRASFVAPISALTPATSLESSKVIDQILADHVTPLAKVQGFKKKGRTYYRLRDGRWDLLGIQANKWNSADEGSFTVNLGIFVPEVYQALWDNPLSGLPHEYDCVIRHRIAEIGRDGYAHAGGRSDKWWKYSATTNLETLGADLKREITERAMPFYAHLGTKAAIFEHVRSAPPVPMPLLERAALAVYGGDLTLGQDLLDRAFLEYRPEHRFEQRRPVSRIAARLGLKFESPVGEEELVIWFEMAGHPRTGQKLVERLRSNISSRLQLEGSYIDRVMIERGRYEIYLYGPSADAILKAITPAIKHFAKHYKTPIDWRVTAFLRTPIPS